ncbi:MAG: heme-binding beta-barrel domain-containing protein [Acidimicrobiales bacterium]
MSGTVPEIHPGVAGVAFLLGTWRGAGEGRFATVDPFAYDEQVVFGHVGKPFLTYAQRTWARADHRPLHAETGFLRPAPDGRVELVVAHPTGHVEVSEGTVDGTHLVLHSTLVAGTATAKEVRALTREIDVDGDELRYRLAMEAVGQPLQDHLAATLHREDRP